MVRRALLCTLLLLSACFPGPLDETGERCDPDHGCGDGFTCFDLHCQRTGAIDAGPANFLLNPDFEELDDGGAIAQWRAAAGDVVQTGSAHHGLFAARLFSPDGGTFPTLLPQPTPIQLTLLGQVWCARGWARAEYSDDGGTGLPSRLDIYERFIDGGTPNASATGFTRVTREWLLFEQRLVTAGDGKLDVRIETNQKFKKSEAVVIDEMQLKRSIDGVCRW